MRPTLIYGKSINKVDKNINLKIQNYLLFPINSTHYYMQNNYQSIGSFLKTINQNYKL